MQTNRVNGTDMAYLEVGQGHPLVCVHGTLGDFRTWYRVMYLARIENVIHVLHCFEKDTRKTERRDVQTARARLSNVLLRINEGKS